MKKAMMVLAAVFLCAQVRADYRGYSTQDINAVNMTEALRAVLMHTGNGDTNLAFRVGGLSVTATVGDIQNVSNIVGTVNVRVTGLVTNTPKATAGIAFTTNSMLVITNILQAQECRAVEIDNPSGTSTAMVFRGSIGPFIIPPMYARRFDGVTNANMLSLSLYNGTNDTPWVCIP